ncbi:Cupin -type [Pyrrhoderma noxium]|uniref:Cupin-type n=1 Tax=Pyrrhoderma noxium TaxID=2282107 RepID=A0A286UTH9_9AGAM|nr:Cupin -type [Pyrrhoderma noxium]
MSSISSEASHPPIPTRRVVTGHTPSGNSIIVEDEPIPPRPFNGTPSFFTDLYWTDKSVPDNDVEFKDLAKEHPHELIGPEGSSLKVVWLPPGQVSPFHRTVTLDYGIVMQGSITLILDDNKRVVLHPGDVIVQRGTIHAWKNEGTEWTKVYFIVFPSQKVKIGDKELETEFRKLE